MSVLFKNPITWKKQGLIFKPDTDRWWMKSHAMIPTPHKIEEGIYKVFFSGRNENNQSHIGWFLIDLNHPTHVIEVSEEPVLAPGRLGCFDDNGVTPSCLIHRDNELYLYYIGWNPGSTVRMHLFGGLAIASKQDGIFTRWSEAPIIERCPSDPFLNTAPWVVKAGNQWRMYYVSGVGWVHKDLPRYNIKIAYSDDGKNWHREGQVCIDFANEEETALARPYVIFDEGIWRMWFAYKGQTYKLGYAESLDGITWHRNDALVGIDLAGNKYDSDMMEYAAVVKYQEKYFMFYNGNNYGKDGINLAIGNT